MAINKKLIHFNKKLDFNTRLANNEILDTSIVFIKDTQEIWTHGQLYKCSDPDLSNYLTAEDLNEINTALNATNTELNALKTSVVDLTSDQTISGSKTFTSSKGLTLYNTNASDSELDIYSDASGNKIINNINKGSSTVASGMEINNFTGSTIKIRTYMPGDDVVRAYCTVSPDRSGTICANYLLPNNARRAAGLFISNGSEERGGASVGVNYGGLVTVYPPDNSDSPTKSVNSVTLFGDVVFRSYKDGLSGGDGNYAWMKYDSDDNFIDIRAITPSTNTTYETPILIDSVKINGERIITECTEITYSELKTRRDNSQLIPGAFYRITDYMTTTSQTDTQSAGHPFDIVVLALTETILADEAYAVHSERDTEGYFANSNLSAWKIWYSLDNDTAKFAWADAENGKGVIYRTIDEFNNDIPYDFKNIQFKHPKDTTTYSNYYYTFSVVIDDVVTDYSMLQGNCYGNIMKEYITSKKQTLNNNVFLNTSKTNYCHSNSFGDNCYSNSFEPNCSSNSFGNSCYSNSFGTNCCNVSFGNSCDSNTFGEDCYNVSFGNGCDSNTFGHSCYYVSFGNNCCDNSFGYQCYLNSFGNDCCDNSFEHDCGYNSFGNLCDYNSFGYDCDGNSFGNDCSHNSFGNRCDYNSFGNICYSNSFGHSCQSNSFGNYCHNNSFKLGDSNTGNLLNYCYYNHFDDGCSYNVIWSSYATSSSSLLNNININRGVSGTSSSYNYINITTLNQPYEIQVFNDESGAICIDTAPVALTTNDIDLIWNECFGAGGYGGGSASATALDDIINSIGVGDYDEV